MTAVKLFSTFVFAHLDRVKYRRMQGQDGVGTVTTLCCSALFKHRVRQFVVVAQADFDVADILAQVSVPIIRVYARRCSSYRSREWRGWRREKDRRTGGH